MADRGALQTPFDKAVADPGLTRGGSGTSGGVDVDAAGEMVVQSPFTDAISTPGNRETPNSMSGTPPQNTFETPGDEGGPGAAVGLPDTESAETGRTIAAKGPRR